MVVMKIMHSLKLAIQASSLQLKRLGKILFYAYFALMFVCIASVLFGMLAILQKMIFISAVFNTSWIEAIVLIVIAVFAFRLFYREVLRLVDVDIKQDDGVPANTNIIPFPKKSTW